jgi:uncharacterized protein
LSDRLYSIKKDLQYLQKQCKNYFPGEAVSSIHLSMITGGFLLGALSGFLMHRSDYCVAGMFRDLFLFRATRMLKTLLLLIAVSLPLFELIRLTGFVTVPFPFFGPPSLTNLLGGFLFGIGMVLAGGCVVGTLYKLGAGSFPSLLAFLGLVVGSTLFACLYPQWVLISRALALPTKAMTLPQLLGLPPWLLVSLLVLVFIALIWRWFRDGSLYRTGVVDGYLQPWQAALGLALIGAASVLLVGMPMGITTSYAKFGAMLLDPLASEQYTSLNYFQLVPLRYTPPLGGGMISGGPGSGLDAVALIQFPLIFGIVAGSAWSAISLGEWRMHFKLPWRQVVSAVLGGIIMGLASRMAPACNIWHLFGGLPIMALQSFLFLAGLLPGAWLGGLLLTRLVMPR